MIFLANIFKILQNIFDMLVTLFDFLIGIIQDTVYIASLLPELVAGVIESVTLFIPAEALVVVTAMITLTVLYRILGRD